MEFPFAGGSYEDFSKNLNSQVCQNLYPVIDPGLTLIVNFE